MTRLLSALALAGPVLLATLAGCGPSDPTQRILEERARWNVQLTDWAVTEDGAIRLITRVSGPVSSDLEQLTVRILLQDAAGATADREWVVIDLSDVERGGPEDIPLKLAPREWSVEGIGLEVVTAPGPDDVPHIRELQI